MGTHPIVIGGRMSETLGVAHNVVLSDDAVAKVKALLEQEGHDDLRLCVVIQPGGCFGLMYQLYFGEHELEGDAVRDFGGVEVIIDKMSEPCLDGVTVGFADGVDRQSFTIDNSNAVGSCACDGSFH